MSSQLILAEPARQYTAKGIADRIQHRLPVRVLIPLALAAVCFTCYSAWSVVLHRTFNTTGFDLGIFEQAVRSYAEGSLPISDLKGVGFPLLGDHFSPILALLAPAYLLWRSPETLLIAQAALFAASVVPVVRLAIDRIGTRAGAAIGLCYGMSWGLCRAVSFDFHEICFAVPLLAFALERLARRKWIAAVAFTIPLVLVKEDLPITVAAIGLYLAAHRQRRLGLSLAAFGTLYTILVVLVVVPAINPAGGYAYWSAMHHGGGSSLPSIGIRLGTVIALLAPTAFVAVRSPLLLLALPTIGWRFVSGNPAYWGTQFHYSAVLMPIVFIAFIDGLARLRTAGGPGPVWLRQAAVRVCLAVTAVFFLVFPSWTSGQPPWTASQQTSAQRVLDMIPDNATVAASNRLAPHLTSRCRVRLFPFAPASDNIPEWLAVAIPPSGWPTSATDEQRRMETLPHLGYRIVSESDSVVLLHRIVSGARA